MTILKSILATVAGGLLLLPSSTALPSAPFPCNLQANFTLIAHAPGTVIDGWKVAANFYSKYLSVSPNDAAEALADNFAPVTFFKTEANKDRLGMYLQDQKLTVFSPIDGNLQGGSTPGNFPYYDSKFPADVQLLPPSGYINFHPGPLKNPGDYQQPPAAIGGFFACFDNSFDDYYVWGGTYAFQTSTFYPDPSLGCIAFKAKIVPTGFGANCHL